MTRRSSVIALILVYALVSSPARAQGARSQSGPATATVPRSVPFSGQILTATGEARSGAALLTFGLYADQKDGSPLWTEQQLVTLDASGRYSVILGSAGADGLPVDAFAASTPKWLGVTVEAEPEEPRIMLLSVPYALKAADADSIGGTPASEFVVRANLFDTVTSTLKAQGYAPRPSNPTTSVPGVLAVFTDASNSIGNSNVVQSGSNIGINVNPSYPLHVFGVAGGPFGYQTLRLDNPHIAGSSFTLGPTFPGSHVYSVLSSGPASALGAGFFGVYDEGFGAFRLVIDPNGNVGIGRTNPQQALDVFGNIRGFSLILTGGAFVGGMTSGAVLATVYSPGTIAITGTGNGDDGFGVKGISTGRGVSAGVFGTASDVNGTGILGEATGGGFAGTFNGKVRLNGAVGITGVVGIGTTTPTARLHVEEATTTGIYSHNFNGVAVWGRSENYYAGLFEGYTWFRNLIFMDTLGAAGSDHLCRNGSNQIASCSSSLRYKTDVEPFTGGLDIVAQLRPIRFTWKTSGESGLGLAAEDVHEVEPLLTFTNDRGEIEGVRYDQLSAVFVNAIREQQAEIDRQREELQSQQRQIDDLRRLMCSSQMAAPACLDKP